MARRGQEDAYYHRAKREGYAARSVYKLEELDRRFSLLRKGQKVLDLGCHPGSWLQYISAKVGPGGLVVGVDLKPPAIELGGNARFVQGDMLAISAGELAGLCPVYDLVLSDAAPQTTGIAHADQARSGELAARAFELALSLLRPGGDLVAKVYHGPEAQDLTRRVKQAFKQGKAYKSQVTTSGSREMFLVGKGLKPPPTLPNRKAG